MLITLCPINRHAAGCLGQTVAKRIRARVISLCKKIHTVNWHGNWLPQQDSELPGPDRTWIMDNDWLGPEYFQKLVLNGTKKKSKNDASLRGYGNTAKRKYCWMLTAGSEVNLVLNEIIAVTAGNGHGKLTANINPSNKRHRHSCGIDHWDR